MKKVIYVNDLCCQRCAEQMATKVALVDGVLKAKADYKHQRIFVELEERVFAGTDMEVLAIEKRKGIFGWKALQFALQTKKNKV